MEIIAIIKSRKIIESGANFGSIFHKFGCFFINFHHLITNFDEKINKIIKKRSWQKMLNF
jgi:hypothetical protein